MNGDGKNGTARYGFIPWVIAGISLTIAVVERINAPAKDIAALSRDVARIEERVVGVQKDVAEVKIDLKRHVEQGK